MLVCAVVSASVSIGVLVSAFKKWDETKSQFGRAAPLVALAVSLSLPGVVVSILHLATLRGSHAVTRPTQSARPGTLNVPIWT